jgi:hypothetical protein
MSRKDRAARAGRKEAPGEDLGYGGLPFCREPWESYYILRRGILPCCHGNKIIAPMDKWEETWNSAKLQEIRRYLSQGRLSPYCLESLGCPIVQRHLREKREAGGILFRRPKVLRIINRLMFKVPGKIVRFWSARKARR